MADSVLPYNVIDWSSYYLTYKPRKISDDCPNDPTSRWSSETNTSPQYLLLELNEVSLLSTITFGKFKKSHVCNLKRFKVYAGLTENNLTEVLDGGLQNDDIPETFYLYIRFLSHQLPVKYVKIVPLQSWGTSFNFSIWYVRLTGTENSSIVRPHLQYYSEKKENHAIRVCLKHFREQGYDEAFEALRKKTKVDLEDSLLAELHQSLVKNGDYSKVEEIMEQSTRENLFLPDFNEHEFEIKWSKIEPVNRDGSDHRPGARGGHQMVINPYAETLYMFGGWDGTNELADLWSYHIPSQQWTLLSSDTKSDGGPSARSCHKMVIDCERACLFVLGRYLESAYRSDRSIKSAFYMYDITQAKWTLITDDTFGMGGPRLIYDHQMCIDVQKQMIYVFGGKALSSSIGDATEMSICSGLYSYHIPTNHWRRLRSDCAEMKSRYGHSMMLDNATKMIYIYGGQRGKEFLSDLLVYDIEADGVATLNAHNHPKSLQVEPPPGFTQRATLDVAKETIHLLLSMDRLAKGKERSRSRYMIWKYNIAKDCWYEIPDEPTSPDHPHPVPRFAHQLVYDHIKKIHYMFGGNPGVAMPSVRLDDLWSLSLCKPSNDVIVRQLKYMIRKHKFKELAMGRGIQAVDYLRNDVFEVVNHESKRESDEFQKLASLLFNDPSTEEEEGGEGCSVYHTHRVQLFERLVKLYPSTMTYPKENLLDLVK